MHRGARRATFFFKRDDHLHLFMNLLGDVVDAFELGGARLLADAQPYHLLMRSPHGNLSRGMRQLNASYTQRVNRLERWDGPILRGRFLSHLIKDEPQLPYLFAYIQFPQGGPYHPPLLPRLDQPPSLSRKGAGPRLINDGLLRGGVRRFGCASPIRVRPASRQALLARANGHG